jgi:hypothetical protein
MMFPGYRTHPRRYGQRFAAGQARRCTLSVRVPEGMKDVLAYLAAYGRVSLCEYAARVLNEHLLKVLPKA